MSLKRKSQEAREVKRNKHGFVRLLAFAAILVTAVYVVVTVIRNNKKINSNLVRYDQLVEQTNAINEENEKIAGYLENDDNLGDYIENIAREKLDFANADERIYYVVPSGE